VRTLKIAIQVSEEWSNQQDFEVTSCIVYRLCASLDGGGGRRCPESPVPIRTCSTPVVWCTFTSN